MGKGKGFDPVADAQELARHNINPYYWVNKVTSYTSARWMAEKRVAVVALPFYMIAWIVIIRAWILGAAEQSETVWQYLFDFSNGPSVYRVLQALFLAFYTGVVLIMVLQMLLRPGPHTVEDEHPQKKEKKQPKRRKDYH